jgi:hypothetical protein
MSNYMRDFNSAALSSLVAHETKSFENFTKSTKYHMTKNEALLYIVNCMNLKLPAHLTFYDERDRKITQSRTTSEHKFSLDKPYSPMVLDYLREIIVWEGEIFLKEVDSGVYWKKAYIDTKSKWNDMGWMLKTTHITRHTEELDKLIRNAIKKSDMEYWAQ